MQGESKKKKPWKSFYLSCRHHLPCCSSSSSTSSNNDKNSPINPIPLPKNPSLLVKSQQKTNISSLSSQNKTAQMHLQRVSELEKELAALEEWLHTELAQLRSHFRSSFDGRLERVELDDHGGYLYYLHKGMMLRNGTYQDFPIKFSPPILVPPHQFGSNISQILNQIDEKMESENLITWLEESFSMTNNDQQGRTTTALSRAPEDFEEAILRSAAPKLGELVVEGLQIQMDVKEAEKLQQWRRENGEDKSGDQSRVEEGVIMAMLIQPRDPHQELVNNKEVIVGFVEVEDDEESGVVIGGVHVVGFMPTRRYGNGYVMHRFLWGVSMSS